MPQHEAGTAVLVLERHGDTRAAGRHGACAGRLALRRAKLLLREGLPITQVAVEAGFYDQAHLTRHFKRIVGLPPARYVKEVTT